MPAPGRSTSPPGKRQSFDARPQRAAHPCKSSNPITWLCLATRSREAASRPDDEPHRQPEPASTASVIAQALPTSHTLPLPENLVRLERDRGERMARQESWSVVAELPPDRNPHAVLVALLGPVELVDRLHGVTLGLFLAEPVRVQLDSHRLGVEAAEVHFHADTVLGTVGLHAHGAKPRLLPMRGEGPLPRDQLRPPPATIGRAGAIRGRRRHVILLRVLAHVPVGREPR